MMNKLNPQEVLELVRAGFSKEEIMAMQSNTEEPKQETKQESEPWLTKEEVNSIAKSSGKIASNILAGAESFTKSFASSFMNETAEHKKSTQNQFLTAETKNAWSNLKKAWKQRNK